MGSDLFDLSTKHDLIDTKLRALINIGYASQDLQETLEATEVAFEESKRVGDRNHASFVAGNLARGMMYLLRLDDAQTVLDDPVWSSTPSHQPQRLTALADLQLRRGTRQEAESHRAAARELLGEIRDAQARLALERVEAVFALTDGNPQVEYETAVRHFEETPLAPWVSVLSAIFGATMMGDLDKVRRAKAMAHTLPPGGLFGGSSTRWADIMFALLEGDIDGGLQQADELIEWKTDQGLVWQTLPHPCHPCSDAAARPRGPGRYLERLEQMLVPAGALGLWDWIQTVVDAPH